MAEVKLFVFFFAIIVLKCVLKLFCILDVDVTGIRIIERNPFNCVRLSSVSELNRTQSDGLSSIEFD